MPAVGLRPDDDEEAWFDASGAEVDEFDERTGDGGDTEVWYDAVDEDHDDHGDGRWRRPTPRHVRGCKVDASGWCDCRTGRASLDSTRVDELGSGLYDAWGRPLGADGEGLERHPGLRDDVLRGLHRASVAGAAPGLAADHARHAVARGGMARCKDTMRPARPAGRNVDVDQELLEMLPALGRVKQRMRPAEPWGGRGGWLESDADGVDGGMATDERGASIDCVDAAAMAAAMGTFAAHEFSVLPDSGAGATMLTSEVGMLWDGDRSRTVNFLCANGDLVQAAGGGEFCVALFDDAAGVWRKESYGAGFVSPGATSILGSVKGAQGCGLGTHYPSGGGAYHENADGVKYDMTPEGGVHMIKAFLLPSRCNLRSGDAVDVSGLPELALMPAAEGSGAGAVAMPAGAALRRRAGTDEQIRYMRRVHAVNHEGVASLNRRVASGEFHDNGCYVTVASLGCDACRAAKTTAHYRSLKQPRLRPERALFEWQVDIYEPRGESVGNRDGFKYILGFVCRATGFAFMYYMRSKAAEECLEGLKALEKWLRSVTPDVEAKLGYEPKISKLCMDVEPGMTTTWGYTRSVVDEYILDQGYDREFTSRATPHKNGQIERYWRTMDEGTSASLFDSGMAERWYYDACGVWVVNANHSPTESNKLGGGEPPAKTLGLRSHHPGNKRYPFGSPAWIKRSGAKERKRGDRGVFIGYGGDTKGLRVVRLVDERVMTDMDVHVEVDLAPVMNFVTSCRQDPLYALLHGDLVWRTYDRTPKARIKGVSVMNDHEVSDELDKNGAPMFEPVDESEGPLGGRDGAPTGAEAAVPADETSAPKPAPRRSRVTVGESAADDSRRVMRQHKSKKPKRAGGGGRRKNGPSEDVQPGDVMSDAQAERLIRRARDEGLRVHFDPSHSKRGMSGERWELYSKFTTVEQCDEAVKTPLRYGSGRVETVMKSDDLRFDLTKGNCQVLDGVGAVVPAAAVRLVLPEDVASAGGDGVEDDDVVYYDALAVQEVGGEPGLGQEVLGRPTDDEILKACQAWVLRTERGKSPTRRAGRDTGAVDEMPGWLAMAFRKRMTVWVEGMREPITMAEAVRLPEWASWQEAVRLEVSKLLLNHVWDEVPRESVPEGRLVVPSHFILKIKTRSEERVDADGKVRKRLVLDKVKARIVFGGHKSVYGHDFWETSAFVASPKSVRSMLALAAPRDYDVVSWDIGQAFTISEIPPGQDIFMELPPMLLTKEQQAAGMTVEDVYPECGKAQCRGTVAKLVHYLYGQKDASRAWSREMQLFMKSIGAKACVSDRMAFRWRWKGHEMTACVHVDDIVATVSSEAIRAEFEHRLIAHFGRDRVTGGEETDYVLGMEIARNRRKKTLTISQGAFARKLLEKCGMEESRRAVKTPMKDGAGLRKWDGAAVTAEQFDYLMVVGSLQWMVCSTRPDLAQATGMLARYSNNPGPEHVEAARHVLRYVAGTCDLGVTYHGSAAVLRAGYDHRDKLIAAVDSDLGGCNDSQKSTAGVLVMLNGGAISWRSKLMSTNSTATLEAEMKAAAMCSVEVSWLRDLVSELGVEQGCVRVLEDNTGCAQLAHGAKDTAKSNHFKRAVAYVEDNVSRGVLWLDDVDGSENPADIFTKDTVGSALHFGKLRDIVMGVNPELHLSRGVQEMLTGSGTDAGVNSLVHNVREWLAEDDHDDVA